jgi:dTDP-4-dehydrorhamnose reductase
MRILIIGSNGRLGSSFKNYFNKKNITFFSQNNKKNTLGQKKFQNFLINKLKKKIDVIINCTGLVDVNFCNKNFSKALKINSGIMENIVTSLKKTKINPILVHFSTDQIYNSLNKKKSKEQDVNLSNFYSISKFLGELKVQQMKKHIIIRTNFFGKSYNKKKYTYSEFLIKNLKNKKIKVPTNIFFNPILIDDLVKNSFFLVKKKIYGVFNIGSTTCMNKYEFALRLSKIKNLPKKNILPYNSTYAKNQRPLFTVMNTKKFSNKTGIKLPSLEESMSKI